MMMMMMMMMMINTSNYGCQLTCKAWCVILNCMCLFNSIMSQILPFFRFKGDGEHVTPISEAAK